MGEAERAKMEKQVIGEASEVDCPMAYSLDIDGAVLQMDGWAFPAFEVKRISDARNSVVQETPDYYYNEAGETFEPISVEELRYDSFAFVVHH
jgi:midasin